MSILAEFHGVEDLFEAELISKGYYAPRAEGVMVNYLFVMESVLDGEIFISGAKVDERVQDWLRDSEAVPAPQNPGAVFTAGAMVHGIIAEPLWDYEQWPAELGGVFYAGGCTACKAITEYLRG